MYGGEGNNEENVPSATSCAEWKAPTEGGACADTMNNKHDRGLQKHSRLTVTDSQSPVNQTEPQLLSCSPLTIDATSQSDSDVQAAAEQQIDSDEDKVVLRKNTMPAQDHLDGNVCIKSPVATEKSEKLCGWLNKLGNRAIVKTFKTRWFVYGDSTCKLYYYRTAQDLLPLGEINIHNASFFFDVTDKERPGLFEIRYSGLIGSIWYLYIYALLSASFIR